MAKIKRKGRYEYEMKWHQDHSMKVVAKVAEQALLRNAPIRATVENWPDIMDFMICIKVPRSSYLCYQTEAWGDQQFPVQNTCRYFVSRNGVELNKWMPPLKDKTEWRKIGVQKGYKVAICNDLKDVPKDWRSEINFDYYINEVEKLVMGLT